MNRMTKITAITVTTLLVGTAAVASWGERHGYCDRDDGPRAGMMKERMGGHHGRHRADRDLDLTIEQVRTLVEARLIMRGKEGLSIGEITEVDDDRVAVTIVAAEGAVVRQFEIDRDSGRPLRPRRDAEL